MHSKLTAALLGGATSFCLASFALERPRDAIEAAPFFVALSVDDVDESRSWYEALFGFELVRSTDLEARGFRIRLLRKSDGFLELVESASAVALAELEPPVVNRYEVKGLFKFGFRVADLDATRDRLAKLEIPLRGGVVTEEDGSMRSLQAADPDGNVIQLFEILDD